MPNNKNVNSEFELYEPMRNWLHKYLEDKYRGFEIVTLDAHAERLDRVLVKLGIVNELATGVDWIYVNTLDINLSFYFFFYYLGIQNIKLLRFSPDSKSYIPKQLYKFARTPLESYS